jgi:ribose transport system substrate-binding protein
MKQLRWLALLMVGAVALSACPAEPEAGDAGDDPDQRVLALVTPYYASATTKEVLDKVKAQAEALGWRAEITDTAGDFDRLNGAIQDAVTLGVDAIVLGMGDPGQMTRGLDAASEAGIPVFAVDAAPGPGIVVNVTSDNTDLGRQSAQWLVEEMGGSGAVLMFTHDPHPGVRARAEAAAAVFDEAGIEIVQRIHIEVPGPVDNARRAMQDFLTANPGDAIGGVWAGWDEPALGATQAIEAAGREGISVVGVDGTDFALAEIEKGGPFGATVKQDWDAIASRTVELIEAYFDGQSPPAEQEELPGQLITRTG